MGSLLFLELGIININHYGYKIDRYFSFERVLDKHKLNVYANTGFLGEQEIETLHFYLKKYFPNFSELSTSSLPLRNIKNE